MKHTVRGLKLGAWGRWGAVMGVMTSLACSPSGSVGNGGKPPRATPENVDPDNAGDAGNTGTPPEIIFARDAGVGSDTASAPGAPLPETPTTPAPIDPAPVTPPPAPTTPVPTDPVPTTPAPTPPPAVAPPAAGDKVTVHLQRTTAGAKTISFGVPLPPGKVANAAAVRVLAGGAPIADAATRVLLSTYDKDGAPKGVRAVQIQFPAAAMTGDQMDVDVVWNGAGPALAAGMVPFASGDVSGPATEAVTTTARTIVGSGDAYQFQDGASTSRTLFTSREPLVVATFPKGYLAGTRLLGEQVTAEQAARPEMAGLTFFSKAAIDFGLSAMYADNYGVNPASVVDPLTEYEGWLYDRCATFLTFYAHTDDARFLRHALRSCSYYAGQINTTAPNLGIFKGKPTPDIKYSHIRGLYAYYALSGDETALEAAKAMATMWESDPLFVMPYRAGKLRGTDKLWTERLLGASLEGLYYGHQLTGDVKYLTALREMVATTTKHITGDAATLAALNPGVGPFPPQNCFVHSALQHAEGNAVDPWCSGWMNELAVDALLRYQEQTGDPQVDEIFIRLTRFLRDTGSQYLKKDVQNDFFMQPKVCFNAADGESTRVLVPLYGSAVRADGTRANFGEWDDIQHCADATSLTAAGLRALKRTGRYDANPIGPFASEGESFMQLHQELAFCARQTFASASRMKRDPATWTSAELKKGAADPAKFIADNKIGYPTHQSSPQRKLSWWFNGSMMQFGLLTEAGLTVPALSPGRIQPTGCN